MLALGCFSELCFLVCVCVCVCVFGVLGCVGDSVGCLLSWDVEFV